MREQMLAAVKLRRSVSCFGMCALHVTPATKVEAPKQLTSVQTLVAVRHDRQIEYGLCFAALQVALSSH